MQGRYRGLLLALALGLCGIFGAGQAQAWTTPVGVSPKGNASLIGAGMGPGGGSIIGWENRVSPPVIQARIRRPDGSLSAIKEIAHPVDLHTQPHFLPQMQMNPSGTEALFLWEGFDGSNYRVQMRTMGTNGTLGPVITATPPNKDAASPAFGVDGSGNIVLAWVDGPTVLVRTISAGGALGPITVLPPPGERAYSPMVAVDLTGDSVIGWGTGTTIHAVQRQSDGTLGPILDTGSGGGGGVATDPSGDAVFMFDSQKLFARQLSAAGTFGPLVTVAAGTNCMPDFGVDDSGDSVFIWCTSGGLRARSLSSGGALGPLELITLRSGIYRPQLALNSSGDSVIGWEQLTGNRHEVKVVERAADGTRGPVQTLGGSVRDYPMVDLNDGGQAIAAWTSPPSSPRVRVSVGP